MKEATKLSPAVENKKGIDKDSDVSKRENGFVFVPVDDRLLRTIESYLRKKRIFYSEDPTLVEYIHGELLQTLRSNYDYYFGHQANGELDFDVWYPDSAIFKELPEVKLGKGPHLNPRIPESRIREVQARLKEWEKEDKKFWDDLETDPRFQSSIRVPKTACSDGQSPTDDQQAKLDALCSEMNTRAKEIMGIKE